MLLEQYAQRGRPKQVRVRCSHCRGTGKDIVKIPGKTKPTIKPCPVCGGKGYIVKSEGVGGGMSEQAPTNSMGGSSSSQGPIVTYDPLLNKAKHGLLKRRRIIKI